MMGQINEQTQAKYVECMEKLSAKLDKHMEGRKWICGDKVTIADAVVCFFAHSFIWNESMPAGAAWSDKAKEAVGKHPNFMKYIDTLKEEWKEWLETRPKCSLWLPSNPINS